MTRIVYGISGEGSGHSSRAREIMTHLQGRGHEVKAVSYDRGYRNLERDFDVFETEGLHIASAQNQVSVVKTFTDNLSRLSNGVRKLRELKKEVFKDFAPEVVITDFEPMTAYLANHYGLPLVSLDNQHRMRYMQYPRPRKLEKDAVVAETVIRALVPRPDVSLVTTFYFGETTNQRTFLFPPILQNDVLDFTPKDGEHILIYFTADFSSFLEQLRHFEREFFVVYGTNREGQDGNVVYQRPSRERFLRDLGTAKAVIATAGFTLMTESLKLQKPYLALPMRGQFEQELNALLLEEMGCGKNGREPSAETVGDFLYHLPDYRERLETLPTWDNTAIHAKLDALLADDARELRAFSRA